MVLRLCRSPRKKKSCLHKSSQYLCRFDDVNTSYSIKASRRDHRHLLLSYSNIEPQITTTWRNSYACHQAGDALKHHCFVARRVGQKRASLTSSCESELSKRPSIRLSVCMLWTRLPKRPYTSACWHLTANAAIHAKAAKKRVSACRTHRFNSVRPYHLTNDLNRAKSCELHLYHVHYLYSSKSNDVVQSSQNTSLQTCHQARTHSVLYHSHRLILRTRTPSCTHPSLRQNSDNAHLRTMPL